MKTLKQLLYEGIKEKAALKFLSDVVKESPFSGKVFVAGGAVRDELMGLDLKDIDLVISVDQGGIKFAEWMTDYISKTFNTKKFNPVIFPKFGTASFKLAGVTYDGIDLSDMDIECVMSRAEQYHDKESRNPDVKYGTLGQDVERRDFTVNSLLKDLTTGEILDLTGQGKDDIAKGIVRTPLDPNVIFSDDPLRMLRAIRFTVKYGWKLPFFMIKAIKSNAYRIEIISAERINTELSKMLISPHPDTAIRLLQITGLSKYIIPELDQLIKLQQNKYHKWDAMKHTLLVLKNTPPNLETRLAALFHDIGKAETQSVIDNEIHFYTHEMVSAKIAKDIMVRLKYPTDVIVPVVKAVANHMRTKFAGDTALISTKSLRKLQDELGDHLDNVLSLIHADNISHDTEFDMPNQVSGIRQKLAAMGNIKDQPTPPIDGDDIMKILNIGKGAVVGYLKDKIKEYWYDNPNITKERCINIVTKEYEKLIASGTDLKNTTPAKLKALDL